MATVGGSGIGGASASALQLDRGDFFQYAVSLMRGHASEHGDALPLLDMDVYRYVAIVYDALLMLSGALAALDERLVKAASDLNKSSKKTNPEAVPVQAEIDEFFQRSASLDAPCRDPAIDIEPFSAPLHAQAPLAEKPYLLHAESRPEDLFGPLACDGALRLSTAISALGHDRRPESSSGMPIGSWLTSLRLSLQAWRYSLRIFASAFIDDMPSLVADRRFALPFHIKERLFRRRIDSHTFDIIQPKEIRLQVSRDRHRLVSETFRRLNEVFSAALAMAQQSASSSTSASLVPAYHPCVRYQMNIIFEGEPGEGLGGKLFTGALLMRHREKSSKTCLMIIQ